QGSTSSKGSQPCRYHRSHRHGPFSALQAREWPASESDRGHSCALCRSRGEAAGGLTNRWLSAPHDSARRWPWRRGQLTSTLIMRHAPSTYEALADPETLEWWSLSPAQRFLE